MLGTSQIPHTFWSFWGNLLSKSGVDTTLGSDSVTSCGEQLGDTSSVESSLGQTEGSAQTGTTGTDDDGIVLVILRRSDTVLNRILEGFSYNDRVLVGQVVKGLLAAQRLVGENPGWRNGQ